jgi:DNA repair photolyase
MLNLCEIKAASVIGKSNLPSVEYVINPYVGCTHACVYCYAQFMKKFTNHAEAWGKFIDVKINAADLVPTNTDKYRGKKIWLSSVTDPYLPCEKKYQLTRQILIKLIPLQPYLSILTKSDLVLRDLDLLKQFPQCEVGVSLTTLDEKLRTKIEPGAVSIERRINVLKEMKKAGVSTYVFISPILPVLSNWKGVVVATKEWSDFYFFENLNARSWGWTSFLAWLKKDYPQLAISYRKKYFENNDYWQVVRKEITNFCQKEKIDYSVGFHE